MDGEGAVTAAYDYWPYGKVLASSGTGATHFRFTGHERDTESGLDYVLERSYAYDVGRFLRPDPMQDKYPWISPYAYAANNPLKFVDPDGKNHHEVWTSPENYVAHQAKAVVDHVTDNIEELVDDTVEIALDVTKKAIEETIVFSDVQTELAEHGVRVGLATAAVGAITFSPPTLAVSGKVLAYSSAVGTAADINRTAALSLKYLFFDGSGEDALKQAGNTVLNAVGGRIVKVVIKDVNRLGF